MGEKERNIVLISLGTEGALGVEWSKRLPNKYLGNAELTNYKKKKKSTLVDYSECKAWKSMNRGARSESSELPPC